ncbi:MAG TPA: winged helix-turn-helix domain-containing protein [Thermohalobaculum sp.]|nr:winged helix-turn-helix domain-containing protein [Thermohalobaculum sp.]
MRDTVEDLREENIYLRGMISELTGETEAPVEGLTKCLSRVIHTLQNASGRSLTSAAIADAVYWDRPELPQSRTIVVFVHRIRKLRPDLGARIKLVSGHGYRWETE